MDLSNLEVVTEAVFFQFNHPISDEPLFDVEGEGEDAIKHPVGAWIYGQDSEQFKKRKRQIQDQKLETVVSQNKKKIKAEDIERESVATICACVQKFERIKFQGMDLTDQRGLFPAFFEKFPWAQEQIDRAIMKRSLFIKASQMS